MSITAWFRDRVVGLWKAVGKEIEKRTAQAIAALVILCTTFAFLWWERLSVDVSLPAWALLLAAAVLVFSVHGHLSWDCEMEGASSPLEAHHSGRSGNGVLVAGAQPTFELAECPPRGIQLQLARQRAQRTI